MDNVLGIPVVAAGARVVRSRTIGWTNAMIAMRDCYCTAHYVRLTRRSVCQNGKKLRDLGACTQGQG